MLHFTTKTTYPHSGVRMLWQTYILESIENEIKEIFEEFTAWKVFVSLPKHDLFADLSDVTFFQNAHDLN